MHPKLKRKPTAFCILVDLDMLLDTRLGVLEALYPNVTLSLLKNGYWVRHNDNFQTLNPIIDQSLYETTWKKRDVNHLQSAAPTGLLYWLVAELAAVVQHNDIKPLYATFHLDINMHPYNDLSREERQEILETLGDVMPSEFSIEEVNLSIKALSPQFLNNNYCRFVTYNYIDWFEFHYPTLSGNEDLIKNQMRNTDVYAPGLFKNHVKREDTIGELVEGGPKVNILDAHTEGVSALFKLNYLHPTIVSVIDPNEIEIWEQRYRAKNKSTA